MSFRSAESSIACAGEYVASPADRLLERIGRPALMLALFATEVVVVQVWSLPTSLDFDRWAFWDPGANLTVQYLILHGYSPTKDFSYHYGLLPLWIGARWFKLFGATPLSCLILESLCNVSIAYGFAVFACTLKLKAVGFALLIAALPFAAVTEYPNLAHAFEAALLCNAIAQQAHGRRSVALMFATIAIFAKPVMGFVYGFVLLVISFSSRERRTMKQAARTLAPSAVVSLAFCILLATAYGLRPLLSTILPVTGARAYGLSGYGILHSGRYFLFFPGARVGYYLGTPVLFWIAGSVLLITAGCGCLRILFARPAFQQISRIEELVLTCATLHLIFVLFFYGDASSWTYYCYILVMGIAATTAMDLSLRAFWALALIAILANKSAISWNYLRWRTWTRDSQIGGLWMSKEESAELAHIISLAASRSAGVVASNGAAELLLPGFEKPVSLYFTPGLFREADVDRKLAQLSKVSVVLVPAMKDLYPHFSPPHRIASTLSHFRLVWVGKSFKVYERSTTASRSSVRHRVSISFSTVARQPISSALAYHNR